MSGTFRLASVFRRPAAARPSIRTSVAMCWLLAITAALPATAQTDDQATSTSDRGSALTLPLPPRLPDGRSFRPIAFFQSQLAELIPADYRPISITRLNDALAEMTNLATDDQASRLRSSVYWIRVVDGTLVSDRSVIDIETDREGIVRRSLGKINLAIDDPQRRSSADALAALPRLESDSDGNLSVVFHADSNTKSGIEFKWRLRGQNVGSGHDFLMRLPRCPQTRIVLSAPSQLSVDSLDGVLRRRVGPPPDAGEFLADSNARWYEIDAGGLTSLRIRTRHANLSGKSETIVVRHSSAQYEIDAGGLTWNSQLVLQLPSSLQLPPLVLCPTTVTSVKVNGIETSFSTSAVDQWRQSVLIDVPAESYTEPAAATTITLSGKGPWDSPSGWCDLPMPVFVGDQVAQASPTHDLQIVVPDSLEVLSWQLPTGWRQTHQPIDSAVVYSAEGPPLAQPPVARAAAGNRSRIRLSRRSAFDSYQTLLRLDVSAGLLQSKSQLEVDFHRDRLEPIQLELQRGWSLDSVTLPASGRDIEIADLNNYRRRLVIWPEPDDVVDSKLLIEATGSSRVSFNGRTLQPTWFLRAADVRGGMTVAVVAPADLNWTGDSAAKIDRIELDQLPEQQQEFFAGAGDDSLLFQPDTGSTPELNLQSPGVSFEVATVLELRRDGNEIIESLVIETDSASQVLPNLTVQTGAAGRRPAYRWLLRGVDDSFPISLPSSDAVLVDQEKGEYTIDLSDRNLRDRQLVARRRYPLDRDMRIQLPSVPKAASQSSEVHLGNGLILKKNAPSVLKVPAVVAAEAEPADVESDQNLLSADGTTRLRYDAVKQPSIVVAKTDVDPNLTIVWREEINVIASSRGTDRIEATYDVSATRPLVIDHDPELQLVSVLRDGHPMDLASILQRPISLSPPSKTETIQITWNRNQISSNWYRTCRMPRIDVSGVKVKSQYRLLASSDTFAPVALLQAPSLFADQAIAMPPGEVATLIRRNIALAIGWFLSAIVFAVSWYVSRRSPILIAVWVILMVTASCLWWPWHLAIIGWAIVPAVAAVLLVVSMAWNNAGNRLRSDQARQRQEEDRSSASSRSQRDSHAISLASIARTLGLFLLIVGSIIAIAAGQEAGLRQARPADRPAGHVNVLVPVTHEGEMAGEIVYIPGSVHSSLLGSRDQGLPQNARFQSASYRIKLDPRRESSEKTLPQVEADFLVHIDQGDRQTNSIKLPFAFTSVRRIEMIGELNKILQFSNDAAGQVIAKLPRGKAFRLRLTLIPAMSYSERWDKLFLSIPPVASSRLTVEADQNIAAIRVGGPSGRLLEEVDLRRWVEEIGPVDSLEVEFQRPSRQAATAAQPLQRRYWLNISKRQAAIDCEVDPPVSIAAGQVMQLVVRDSQLPKLTSGSWRLQRSEMVSATRRLVTLECLNNSPGPIRFLWTRPVFETPSSDENSAWQLEIPEVIAPALGENAEAWIALDFDRDIMVAPTIGEQVEPLSIDHFLAKWKGYRGHKPDRAMIAVSRLPKIELQLQSKTQPQASGRHHLHVTAGQLQLRYTVSLEPGGDTSNPHTLKLPPGMRLLDVKINGTSVSHPVTQLRGSSEIALGVFDNDSPVAINVTAVMPLERNKQFQLPQIRISPAVATSDLYTISRDRGVLVRLPSSIKPDPSQSLLSEGTLSRGWIPVAAWTTTAEDSANPKKGSGRVRVSLRPTRFDCGQLISLSWIDGQWSMDARVRFQSGVVPDFVDLEIPTRWCSSLEVSPGNLWSRRAAVDPEFQIVRIHCDTGSLPDNTLTIRGRLDVPENGRVAVPNVKVLGEGKRQVQISVPNQLTNEPISWRTSAVEAANRDPRWKEELVSASSRSTFAVANPEWSVELAPLPQIDFDAVAVTLDAKVFSRPDGALVIGRWDLIPGGLDAVDIQLPQGARCLGAWTAGRAVIAESVDTSSDDRPDNLVRVPLSLSRLAQPVEVLIHVPVTKARQADYLPQLLKIPVTQRWLATYTPSSTSGSLEATDVPLGEQRAFAIARSVVESVDHSIDSLAERPKDEIAIWLAPWVSRYRQIAASIHRTADLTIDSLQDESGVNSEGFDSLSAPAPQSPMMLEWAALDNRLAMHIAQYLPDQRGGRTLFHLSNLDGYSLRRVTKLSAANHAQAIQPTSTHGQGLRTMLINSLTLLLVGGLLACLWPARRYADAVIVHPAFWLGIMGVIGFIVAPIPVAAAIVFAAVALPAIPYKPLRRSRK